MTKDSRNFWIRIILAGFFAFMLVSFVMIGTAFIVFSRHPIVNLVGALLILVGIMCNFSYRRVLRKMIGEKEKEDGKNEQE